MPNQLKLNAAYATEQGRKAINEDCAGLHIPDDPYLLGSKGAALVVADGVSSAEAGKEASDTAVQRFLDEYFQTPDTWSVSHCGEKVLSTLNLRLYRKSHGFATDSKGYLCTFSAVVIKGRTAHCFHVGDSRIYLYRNSELKQLTHDHTAAIADGKYFLARALGMDNRLALDYSKVPLEEGDTLLITSDGVHDFVDATTISQHLGSEKNSQQLAEQLIAKSLAADSDDNISCVIAKVEELPSENIDDYNARLTRLPFPPELAPGMKLDGYQVEKELFASSRSQLYLVRDSETGEQLAMKTPSRNFEDDTSYIDRFIQEEWIGKRISSPQVVKIIRQNRPRTALYYLMEYVQGIGLDDWMVHNRPPKPKRAIGLIKQVAEGLKAFHNNEAIHQDLKPGNILVDANDQVKIVDFGAVYVAGIAEMARPLVHEGALGTAYYADPQYLMGNNSGIQGDVYALATITYELFTGELPYGEKIENCRSAFDYDHLRYRNASEFNPVIPVWFDGALKKGVNFDLEQRYGNVEQLMLDLTQPNVEFLKDDPVEKQNASSLMLWKLLSGFWFLLLLLVVYLFSQSN
ncbi:bifunctional protein-serine/threonine kinase/phosphatase [Porticoccus sp. W117]|uniref:bifunctional protein-serine/threonine kinase/phosphatase n=1 Tax=Porticoccus sp. W117 TaxID=3054777 RepID=UPI0025913270|nr:bifunctional protein-serine/threonine kinase/phosphatase [Porticoccus sp. W117]MDM3870381.1 bifunctional protein-serine/threonine kinase/phosphatase [Porticoccus sp. W117]